MLQCPNCLSTELQWAGDQEGHVECLSCGWVDEYHHFQEEYVYASETPNDEEDSAPAE